MRWTLDDCGRWTLENSLGIVVRLCPKTNDCGEIGWRVHIGDHKYYISALCDIDLAMRMVMTDVSNRCSTLASDLNAKLP